MHRRKPAEDHLVLDDDVPAEGGVVGHDHLAADDAVVRDVRRHHEEVVVAHPRHPAAALGAGVHGDMLADAVARADHELDPLAVELQVLRDVPERGEGEDLRVLADRGPPGHRHVALERDPRPEHHLGTDDAVGSDPAAGADLGARLDDRGRMHLGGGIDGHGRSAFRARLVLG